jgi:hypothetical protein
MMTSAWRNLPLLFWLAISPAFAQCQSGIPTAGNPDCIPPDIYHGDHGGTANQDINRSRRWEALAVGIGPKGGLIGRSAAARGKRQASRLAVADCRRQGGVNCKPFAYSEACASVAWANDRYAVEGGADPRRASDSAMASCIRIGGEDCRIFYTSCSRIGD